MTTANIINRLKTGDSIIGLTGLKDCGSGRCVEIRLDGKTDPYYRGIVSFDGYKTRESRFSKNREELENWIIDKTPKGRQSIGGLDSIAEMRKDVKR